MISESDLDAYVTRLIDNDSKEMLKLFAGGDKDGGKAESPEIVGVVGKRSRTDCVSGENVCKD